MLIGHFVANMSSSEAFMGQSRVNYQSNYYLWEEYVTRGFHMIGTLSFKLAHFSSFSFSFKGYIEVSKRFLLVFVMIQLLVLNASPKLLAETEGDKKAKDIIKLMDLVSETYSSMSSYTDHGYAVRSITLTNGKETDIKSEIDFKYKSPGKMCLSFQGGKVVSDGFSVFSTMNNKETLWSYNPKVNPIRSALSFAHRTPAAIPELRPNSIILGLLSGRGWRKLFDTRMYEFKQLPDWEVNTKMCYCVDVSKLDGFLLSPKSQTFRSSGQIVLIPSVGIPIGPITLPMPLLIPTKATVSPSVDDVSVVKLYIDQENFIIRRIDTLYDVTVFRSLHPKLKNVRFLRAIWVPDLVSFEPIDDKAFYLDVPFFLKLIVGTFRYPLK